MAKIVRKDSAQMLGQRNTQDYLKGQGINREDPKPRPPTHRPDPLNDQLFRRSKGTQVEDQLIENYARNVARGERNLSFIDGVIQERDSAILIVLENEKISTCHRLSRAKVEAKKDEIETDGKKVVILEGLQERLFRETVTEARLNDLCGRVVAFATQGQVEEYCQFLSDNMKTVQNSERLLNTINENVEALIAKADVEQLGRMRINTILIEGSVEETDKLNMIITRINRKLSNELRERAGPEPVIEKPAFRPMGRGMKLIIFSLLVMIFSSIAMIISDRNRGTVVDEPSPPAATASVTPDEVPSTPPTRPKITPTPSRSVEQPSSLPTRTSGATPSSGKVTLDRNGLDALSNIIAKELESSRNAYTEKIIKHINGLPPNERNAELRWLHDVMENEGSWKAAADRI